MFTSTALAARHDRALQLVVGYALFKTTGHMFPDKAMPKGKGNRERLLRAGLSLLHEQGYHATGVQQIADLAGVPKGSFYNHFGSKLELARAALNLYADEECEQLEQALLDASGRPVERLARLLNVQVETARRRRFASGCLLGNLCQELAGFDNGLRSDLEQAMRRVQGRYAEVLFEAQQAGELGEGAEADALAAFLYNAWQGALMRCKATRSDAPARDLLTLLPSWIR